MRILQVFDKGPGNGIRSHVDMAADLWRQSGVTVSQLRIVSAPAVDGATDQDSPDTATLDARAGTGARRRDLRQVLTGAAPDIIHVHAGFTTIDLALLDTLARASPTVGVLHDVAPMCFRGTRLLRPDETVCDRTCGIGCWTSGCYRPERVSGLPRQAARSLIRAHRWAQWRRLPALVAPSRYIADLAVAHGADPERVTVVPHVVPPQSDRKTDDGAGPPLLLFVGRIAETKGVFVLAEALTRLADLSWTAAVLGDGPDRAALRARLIEAGLGDRVTLPGARSRDAVAADYRRALCLVFPPRMPESFGLVGIEALSHGCPVVGFANGGPADWLQHGRTGLLAEPMTTEALAGRLRDALNNPEAMRALGRLGQAVVRVRFAPPDFLRTMDDLHRRLLGNSEGAAEPCGAT